MTENATRRFRALFISDVHLGTRGCQADRLLDFLRHHDAGTIYLVGDIVDGWALRSSWYWPQAHNDVVYRARFFGHKFELSDLLHAGALPGDTRLVRTS